MRRHRFGSPPENPPRSDDGPPPLTGDLAADASAALDWLFAHEDRWLTDELSDATGRDAA